MGTHPIFESDFDCLTAANRPYRLMNDGSNTSSGAMPPFSTPPPYIQSQQGMIPDYLRNVPPPTIPTMPLTAALPTASMVAPSHLAFSQYPPSVIDYAATNLQAPSSLPTPSDGRNIAVNPKFSTSVPSSSRVSGRREDSSKKRDSQSSRRSSSRSGSERGSRSSEKIGSKRKRSPSRESRSPRRDAKKKGNQEKRSAIQPSKRPKKIEQ